MTSSVLTAITTGTVIYVHILNHTVSQVYRLYYLFLSAQENMSEKNPQFDGMLFANVTLFSFPFCLFAINGLVKLVSGEDYSS